MSNLSDFFAKAATAPPPQSGNTPHSQLAFTTVGGTSTQGFYDSFGHDSALISRQYGRFDNTENRSNRMAVFTPHNYQTQPGNNIYHTYQAGHGITMNGWLGHNLFDFQLNQSSGNASGLGPFQENYAHTLEASRGCGTVIGLDQDYALIGCYTGASFHATEAHLSIIPRSMKSAIQSSAIAQDSTFEQTAQNRCELHTAGALSSGCAMMVGGISHNQNSGNMVIIERTGAAASPTTPWRPVLLQNVPDPRKYVNRDREYQTDLTTAMATASNRVVGGNPTSGLNSRGGTAYGDGIGKVILCDDNTVVMYLYQGTGTQIHRWKWNSSTNAFNTPEYKELNGGAFTQGIAPNVGWQMTLDGKESVFYSAYRYYSHGFRAIFVDNSNGNMSFHAFSASTTLTYNIAPLGASRFLFMNSNNTDNLGIKTWVNNKLINDRFRDIHNPVHADNFAESATSSQDGYGQNNIYDSSYFSTNYPTMAVNIRVDNKAIVAAENGS
jgi:hypothetical protein